MSGQASNPDTPLPDDLTNDAQMIAWIVQASAERRGAPLDMRVIAVTPRMMGALFHCVAVLRSMTAVVGKVNTEVYPEALPIYQDACDALEPFLRVQGLK